MAEKIVVVVGATGTQGGSVLKAVLASESAASYSKIRCLTRDAKSNKAQTLKTHSPKVEVVEGDAHNYDSLLAAFKGAWAVFAVTNFWDPSVGQNESKCGMNMAKAAKTSGVKYFVWSSLSNSEAISRGKYKVEHFTQKALVSEEARRLGLPLIEVQLGFYMSNFKFFFKPEQSPQEPNKFTYSLPLDASTVIPFVDPTDTGSVVAAILDHPEQHVGRTIPIYGEMNTMSRAVQVLSEVTGKQVEYRQLRYEEASFLGPELLDMFHFFDEFGYYAPDVDLGALKKVQPKLKTIKDWALAAHFQLS